MMRREILRKRKTTNDYCMYNIEEDNMPDKGFLPQLVTVETAGHRKEGKQVLELLLHNNSGSPLGE